MKKVLVFGTFDTLEDRHLHLLQTAADHGDIVMVALSRDGDVNDELTECEYQRFSQILAIDVVDDVILAHGDHADVIRVHKPQIIVIGSHQRDLSDALHDRIDVLEENGCVVVYA
jgi:glycerol-3-phosphate cytidylyltransferase-like family protein